MLGLLGGTPAGLAMAPALHALMWPFVAITVVMLSRGWYLEFANWQGWNRSTWSRRSFLMLTGSTILAISLWTMRFAGVFGQHFH